MLKSAPGISYTNAVFGYHAYGYGGTPAEYATELNSIIPGVQAAGYPVFMTEICESGCTFAAPYTYFYPGLWNAGISANYLSGDGFCTSTTCYGNPPVPADPLTIAWPED